MSKFEWAGVLRCPNKLIRFLSLVCDVAESFTRLAAWSWKLQSVDKNIKTTDDVSISRTGCQH